MAGAKIRGITLEIGGDTSGLTKALKDVNGEIRDTSKQLKDVDRLLKLDPKNTELLSQKQQLLAQNVEQTNRKLEELKKIQDTMDQNGVDRNSDQYMALQREIISTEADLKKAKEAARQFAGVSLESLKAGLKEVGNKAAEVAEKTRGISLAAGGALAGLGGLAYKAIQGADDLNTLAKQTGFATDELQRFKYAADLVDVDFDDIIAASRKLKKAIGDNSDVFAKLGVSTRDANGEMRDVKDVFYDTLRALSRVRNETERDTLAMDLFGKSADDLAGIIDDGGDALKYFGDQAVGILDQETLDKLNAMNDQIDQMKANLIGTATELGAKIAETLGPSLEWLLGKIGELLDWVGTLDQDTLKFILTLLALTAAISPVAAAISNISMAIMFLVSNPIVLLVAAIIALVALIALKGDEIQAKLQEVDNYVQNIFAKDWTDTFGPVLGGAMNDFMQNVKLLWDGIMEHLNGVIDFIRGIFTGDWDRAWNGVLEIFEGVMKTMGFDVRGTMNEIIGWINGGIDALNYLISLVNSVSGLNFGQIGHLPFFANGGTLTHGSAVVGEAGPELLTMNSGKAVVTPLGGNSSGGAPINITVQSVLDGRVIGESTYKYLNQRGRAYGT